VADDGDRAGPAPAVPSQPEGEPAAGPAEEATRTQDRDGSTHEPAAAYQVDLAELRRCLAFSFSAGELSKYAERWRVFTDRDGTAAEGARVLVRALDGRNKLPELVSSLQAHKPLVEWPEPEVIPAPPMAALSEPTSAPSQPITAAALPPAARNGAPGSEPMGGPLVDPFSQPAAPDGQDLGGAGNWWARSSVGTRATMLVIIFAAGIGLGGLAFWLLSRSNHSTDATAPGSGDANIAQLAAAHLRSSVGQVTRACEVDGDGETARDALAKAFRRCTQPEIRPGLAPGPLPPLTSRRPPKPPAPARPTPRRPLSHQPVCLDRCHRFHEQCKASECGAEPTSGAKYAEYQRCLAGCLAKYSQCRLRCP